MSIFPSDKRDALLSSLPVLNELGLSDEEIAVKVFSTYGVGPFRTFIKSVKIDESDGSRGASGEGIQDVEAYRRWGRLHIETCGISSVYSYNGCTAEHIKNIESDAVEYFYGTDNIKEDTI